MAIVKDLLYKATLLTASGDMNREVTGICFDSRLAQPGNLFVAVQGTQVDGHRYINRAISAGCTTIVAERTPDGFSNGITWVKTDNSAKALGTIAANFYQQPSKRIKVVAVTKSSSSWADCVNFPAIVTAGFLSFPSGG